MVNEGTNDRDFTAGTSSKNLTTNEKTVSVKTLERCSNERVDWEMSNFVDTLEDRIQNAISTAIDSIVAPKIELDVVRCSIIRSYPLDPILTSNDFLAFSMTRCSFVCRACRKNFSDWFFV